MIALDGKDANYSLCSFDHIVIVLETVQLGDLELATNMHVVGMPSDSFAFVVHLHVLIVMAWTQTHPDCNVAKRL